MDKDFRACAVCTSTCFKEHGADATQPATAPNCTRPPCFLLTSLEVSTNWTLIPREFADTHGEALRGTVRILAANGIEWSVEVGGPGKYLGFKGGWKNFVASSSVKRGDQMLFSLIAKSCFSVHTFNKLGDEVVPSPPADTKYATPPANGKRKRQEVKAEPVSDDESDDSSDSDMSEYEASKTDAESASESDAEATPKVDDEEILSKPRKRVKRKFTGSTKEVASKPSHRKKGRASTPKDGVFIEPGSCTTTYESRRREVNRAELDRVMEKAKDLKTEFPSIPVLMMPSHVYRGFWLTIPGKFSKAFMPQGKIDVTLEDMHGFEWRATWIRSDKHTGLSGGWAAFSKDHALEEGDVCVFEVINSKDWRIRVHIFRVVEVDLKPGTTGGWDKTYNIVHGALMHQPGAAKRFRSRKSTVKKSSKSTSVKKSTSSAVKKRSSVSEESDAEGSDAEESVADDDDAPLTKLYKEKANSDVTSEEVDVKPKIISMGPIPKISKVKQEPATVKVKQEPGVPATCGMKRENGIYCGDVKPTLEELKASLSQTSSVTAASIVKPEPIEPEPLMKEVARTWHPVVRMLGKRKSPKSPDLHEILVNLGPRVICTSASSCASEDGNGNWWVPRSQFSPDLASCYID